MAIVHCRNANGVVLRLHSMVEVLPGIKESRPVGPAIPLRPGRNEIPDVLWSAWIDQNKGGMPGVVDEEKPPAP